MIIIVLMPLALVGVLGLAAVVLVREGCRGCSSSLTVSAPAAPDA
ncbi:MAG: hypothetical protein ACRDRV_16325 [Pseudonocardiaceae bacterium]